MNMTGAVLSIPRQIAYTSVETVAPAYDIPDSVAHAVVDAEAAEDVASGRVGLELRDQEGNRFQLEMPRELILELSTALALAAARCSPVPILDAGQVGYEAYRKVSEGRSLATGAPIPEWKKLSVRIQLAWGVAAAAIRSYFEQTELEG